MVSDVSKDQSKVDIDNTQFLDMVKVLPQLHKPTQQRLQMTKTSLQTGIDQVHNANTFINKLSSDMAEKDPGPPPVLIC